MRFALRVVLATALDDFLKKNAVDCEFEKQKRMEAAYEMEKAKK